MTTPVDDDSARSRVTQAGGAAAGRAQRGLDLSLGHFRTKEEPQEVDFVVDGPYLLGFDYGALAVTVGCNAAALAQLSRPARRLAKRRLDKLLAEARRNGMVVLPVTSAAVLDALSEDEQ